MGKLKAIAIAAFISVSAFSAPLFADPVTQASSGTISDTDIVSNIQKIISDNNTISGFDMKITSINGLVTLVGGVDTGQQAASFVEIAESVAGVKDINISNLVIRSSNLPVMQAFGDSVLTAKVQGTFMREKLFDVRTIAEMPIQLQVTNSVVYLSGVVDNALVIDKAIALARSVSGVSGVSSKVTVRTTH
jgi:osmotically-inducible protein OsmY